MTLDCSVRRQCGRGDGINIGDRLLRATPLLGGRHNPGRDMRLQSNCVHCRYVPQVPFNIRGVTRAHFRCHPQAHATKNETRGPLKSCLLPCSRARVRRVKRRVAVP